MAVETDTASGRQATRWVRRLGGRDRWVHLGLIVSILLMSVPVLIALVFSTKGQADLVGVPTLTPGTNAFENYLEVIVDYNMGRYMLNSLVMALVITAGKLLISLLAVLAIVYYDFPFKNLAFLAILFTLMLPIPVRIVPLYDLMVTLGWTNSLWALTIPYLASATTVFILRQHFLSIPASLVENAKLDGVGPFEFLLYVLIPMSKGVLAGVAVIMFIHAWNQYLWPLLVINDNSLHVAQVGLTIIEDVADTGQRPWHLMMAGAILTLLPPLALLVLARKPLLETFGIAHK